MGLHCRVLHMCLDIFLRREEKRCCDGYYPILSNIQPIRLTRSTVPQSKDRQFSYTKEYLFPNVPALYTDSHQTQYNNALNGQASGPRKVAQPRRPPIVHNRASTDVNGYPDPHTPSTLSEG